MKKIIFITGGTGSVGSYVLDQFRDHPDYHVRILSRDATKVTLATNFEIIEGTMLNPHGFSTALKDIHCLIHIATCWGNQQTYQINVENTIELFRLAESTTLKNIIYFSTASILTAEQRPNPLAESFGTIYIQTKYQCHEKMLALSFAEKIITLYPTMVWGGDDCHPYTHVAKGVNTIKPWVKWLRFINVPGQFHFIHAQDIAILVHYFVENTTKDNHFILGNEAIDYMQLTKILCQYFRLRHYFQIPIPLKFIIILARLIGKELTPWDIYNIEHPFHVFNVTNPKTFGLSSTKDSLAKILNI